jgi:hypothetical protein
MLGRRALLPFAQTPLYWLRFAVFAFEGTDCGSEEPTTWDMAVTVLTVDVVAVDDVVVGVVGDE